MDHRPGKDMWKAKICTDMYVHRLNLSYVLTGFFKF